MCPDSNGLKVEVEEVELLSRLVDAELNRRVAAIDELILRVYSVQPARHTEEAIAEVKAAILVLVHSDLAALERKLACVEPKLEPEPEPEPEVKPEPEPEVKPEPEPKPGKSKA
jgi:outer membrane biosynthesis protein TonB